MVEQNLNLDSNYQINIIDYDFEKNIVSNLENKNSLTEKIEETNISTSKSKKTKNTEKGNLNKKRNLKK